MLETVYLTDPGGALRIRYSPAALEEIRVRAVGGLLSVPRVPVGVGGLLVGVRDQGMIRILDSIDIPCSHSAGPGFSLTAEEKNECQNMMAEAGEADGSGKVTVVGWYCSKTRGDGNLSEEDLNFHREFFPERWQIALVVRPTALDDMPATFYRRDNNGQVIKGIECVVEAWRPAEGGEKADETEADETEANREKAEIERAPVIEKTVEAKPAPVAPAAAAPKPAKPAELKLADLVGTLSDEKPAAAPRPAVATASVEKPAAAKPAARRKRPGKAMLIGGIAAIAVTLAIAAFATQDAWMPRPNLTMGTSEVNGGLEIRWNAAALRGIDHASLYVNDGGTLQTVPMDRYQINAGTFDYKPKTERVTVKLNAGNISGITAWFAAPPAPAPAPAAPTATDPAAAPSPSPAAPDSKLPVVPGGTVPQANR